MQERLISGELKTEDDWENGIRPLSLQEFVGQKSLRENLSVYIKAAKQRDEAIDHILFNGPPGLGKTTLAQIVAKEMNVGFKATCAPIITKSGDLAALLTNLQERDVLFIDEIHRLNHSIEETLYSAMEDFKLDIMIGEGPSAKSIRIDLPKFTLVGATTRIGLLTQPLRERFGIPLRLQFYDIAELNQIIKRACCILDVGIDDKACEAIAKSSRGTPRVANRLLKRIRDFACIYNNNHISHEVATQTLKKLDIDSKGLDLQDINYLRAIALYYNGGPVGIDTLCAYLSEQKDTVEDVIEPYLIQLGFIQKTTRGRVLTKSAYEHLEIKLDS